MSKARYFERGPFRPVRESFPFTNHRSMKEVLESEKMSAAACKREARKKSFRK